MDVNKEKQAVRQVPEVGVFVLDLKACRTGVGLDRPVRPPELLRQCFDTDDVRREVAPPKFLADEFRGFAGEVREVCQQTVFDSLGIPDGNELVGCGEGKGPVEFGGFDGKAVPEHRAHQASRCAFAPEIMRRNRGGRCQSLVLFL